MIAASVKDCQGKHFRVVTWLEKTNQMIAGSEGVSLKMSAKRKWFGEAISGKLVCRREVRLPAKSCTYEQDPASSLEKTC